MAHHAGDDSDDSGDDEDIDDGVLTFVFFPEIYPVVTKRSY